jgi:hypothetical protein
MEIRLQPGAGIGPATGVTAQPAAPPAARTSPAAVRAPAAGPLAAAAPVRAAPSALPPELGLRITRAQLTVSFLQTLESSLNRLVSSAQEAAQRPSEPARLHLAHDLEATAALWSTRRASTLGSLDERLGWSAEQPARCHFRIRGISPESLAAQAPGDRELLSFSILGCERLHGALMVDSKRSPAATLRRLEEALAPLGLNLARESATDIVLTTEESRWGLLTDRLVVRGAGHRFPAGQFTRPRLDPLPSAVNPAGWTAEDPRGVQAAATLASAQVTMARTRVTQSLLDVGHELNGPDQAQTESAAAMRDFAQSFAASGAAPDYRWTLQLIPATAGLDRERALGLLDGGRT